ncbi:MAG: BACON domain-containing carbohydrate-binding protein [Bryobacteraceae bacterium]
MHISCRFLAAVLFAVVTSQAAVAAKTQPAPTTPGADEGLRQAFERAAYSLEDSGHGTWRGENPAQRLTLEFDSREARLSHPDGSVSLHLAGYGRGDRLRKPASATITGAGNRVEYQRGDLTEWYLNGSQGLEQGFAFAHRPGTRRDGEPLVIALNVTGGLLPTQQADDDSVLFESSKGVVLRYAGLRALDARGHTLASRLEVRGREIRLIVDDRDARYPLIVDPTWTQQQELTASDGAPNDDFGYSVSVSGDTAVIGACCKTINSNSNQGAAYVFVRSGGVWAQQQELTAADGAALNYFGQSVSVSGDTAVIGAGGWNAHQGAAYVFVRSGGVWSQQGELTASDGALDDGFGYSVSVSANTAVIGAVGRNSLQGAAYVFVRSGTAWSQQQELTASDGSAGDNFGQSVSVSGGTAVIGAWFKNNDQGAAYVFVQSGVVWSLQQELTASDGAGGDRFGVSVSVSGGTAVIGAPFTTVNSNVMQGAAYVFVQRGATWSQQQELTASDGVAYDEFGWSVSVSGNTAVIGACRKTINANPVQGAAYVFAPSGGVWTQQQELTASDGAAGDNFGYSVSVSGDTAVVGAYGHGAAYVFVRPVVSPGLGVNALLVGSAGGTSSVALAYDDAWTATANDFFLHIAAGTASGTGSAVVVFTYDAFSGTGTRTGTLTIAGFTVTVTQAGTNYIGPGPAITLGVVGYGGVAVDGSGNVYIADAYYYAVEEWSASTQQVTTLVSSGLYEPSGVAVDGSGNVYIADTRNNAIKEWSAATQQVTTLVSTGLHYPHGVAVDGFGNVYIADTYNQAIKEWSASTQQVTTLVSSGLDYPEGVAVDGSGNVYIADTYNNAIREWSAATQQVTTLVSPPAPEQLGLDKPFGAAVDGSGNVYFSNCYPCGILEWNASTQQVPPMVSSGLSCPCWVAVDGSGNIYIDDTSNGAIKEIPNVFVGPASLIEPGSAGTDSLLPVVPATTFLTGIFAPTSDQRWLTIGTITNGVINFSFTANTSGSDRVAHITVLGHQLTVTQYLTSAQFSDVPSSATYYDAANLMFEYGVTTGCEQSSDASTRLYCPDDNVTRQEMAAFIVRAVTGTTNPSIYYPTPYFQDVPASNPFFPHIQKLMDLGITTGCSQNPPLFCPTDTIPRWEMAIFMIRARLMLYGAAFSFTAEPYFSDVPTNVESNGMPFRFIQRSYEEHITNGCGGGDYCPDELVTRGQMASFIMRGLFNQTMVIGPMAPYLAGVGANAVAASMGSQITVTITGVNTSFQSGDTVSVPSGMLTVSNVVVNSATSITATLTVNASAVAGPQALVVTSGGQNLALPLAIKVGTY